MKHKYLEIRRIEDDEAVKRLDLTGRSDRDVERIERGANINLDHKRYYTEVVESENELPQP